MGAWQCHFEPILTTLWSSRTHGAQCSDWVHMSSQNARSAGLSGCNKSINHIFIGPSCIAPLVWFEVKQSCGRACHFFGAWDCWRWSWLGSHQGVTVKCVEGLGGMLSPGAQAVGPITIGCLSLVGRRSVRWNLLHLRLKQDTKSRVHGLVFSFAWY